MLRRTQITHFITGLREQNQDPVRFKIGLRDFLIQLREFQGEGGEDELFADEKEAAVMMKQEVERERASNVPGMLKVRFFFLSSLCRCLLRIECADAVRVTTAFGDYDSG